MLPVFESLPALNEVSPLPPDRPKSLEDSQLINTIIKIDIYFFIINRMLIHSHGFQYILLLTPL